MNRQEAIAKAEASRAEWDALVASVPAEAHDIPAREGSWTLKDLIAHVDFYEWWTGEFFFKRDWPEVDERLDIPDQDERNAVLYELNKDRSWIDVNSASPGMHRHLITGLEFISDEQFEDPNFLGVQFPGDWSPEALTQGASWGHYPQHHADIEAIKTRAHQTTK
jgi:hypothetical protein